MKVYVFTTDTDAIITQIRAENHDQAIAISGLPFDTSFYAYECSEHVEEPTAAIGSTL